MKCDRLRSGYIFVVQRAGAHAQYIQVNIIYQFIIIIKIYCVWWRKEGMIEFFVMKGK